MGGIHVGVFDDAHEDNHDNRVGNIQIGLTPYEKTSKLGEK
jgi:hypothetical protein